jgi:hypothetical protein
MARILDMMSLVLIALLLTGSISAQKRSSGKRTAPAAIRETGYSAPTPPAPTESPTSPGKSPT